MLAEIMHKLAEADHQKDESKKFYPRPSIAGPERCVRQMVYWAMDFPPTPLPGRTWHVFDDGAWHEELVAEWIRRSTFTLHSEQLEIDCRSPMTKGHIDGIVTDLLGVDRLWENKALNHFTFNRFWGGSDLPLDYLTQVAIYIEAIQRTLNPDLKEGILLIKNKNTSQYMEFLVEYSGETDTLKVLSKTHSTGEQESLEIELVDIVREACDKFNQVLEYAGKKTLPKRQYEIDHWRCEYCQYNKTCWERYEQEFNELQTDTMLPDEIADMVRYYKELGGQKSDIEKEYKTLQKKIKDMMGDLNARQGRAGEYIVERKLVSGSRLKKELIPENVLQAASQLYQYERLNIKKIKKEEL